MESLLIALVYSVLGLMLLASMKDSNRDDE